MIATAPRCFVIGPIGEEGSAVRRKADWVLHGLIKPVLEDAAFGYDVKRADQDPNPGSISDAMINDIYDADLVVADLTGFNPNAFYELGIRHAFQKPAIHIIAERGAKPPFDNQDQRTIEVDFDDFHRVTEAKLALTAAVTYVRGSEFRVSNPVTRARGFAALIASGDPKDVLLAKLQSKLDMMSDRVRRLEAPSRLNNVTKPSFSRLTPSLIVRFAEYYDYIRGAAERNLQVPFDELAIDAAINFQSKDEFVRWYSNYKKRNWVQKVPDLNKESFDYLFKNENLIKSLNHAQLRNIMEEEKRRTVGVTETEE